MVLSKIRREDWAESWKRHFKPVEVTINRRKDKHHQSQFPQTRLQILKSGTPTARPSETGTSLLIKPSWSRRKPRKGQIVVVLDPGLGFGTGHHPTTAFCLRELLRYGKIYPRRSFFDIGTGSGILAIAAAKLGYDPVRAIDNDPEAVRVARANGHANGVLKQMRIVCSDVASLPLCGGKRYDLVCANLISTLLLLERQRIVARVKPGGTLVLAGVLRGEFPGIHKVFAKIGLKLAAKTAENEWCSGSFIVPENFQGNLNGRHHDRSDSQE